MIRVQPVYKCLYCDCKIEGAVMELSNRPKRDLVVDMMDMATIHMAKEISSPHHCKMGFKGEHGVVTYVGFNHLGQD